MTYLFKPSPCPQPEDNEILLTRSITFRNSTFGGLKSFIREYARKTGKQLTNAAAVDLLIRTPLALHLNRDGLRQMDNLSTTQGKDALQSVTDKEVTTPDSIEVVPAKPSSSGFICEVRKTRPLTVSATTASDEVAP